MIHVNNSLEQLEASKQIAQNPDQVKAAIWFHDAVYDTKRKDNEEKSAELAEAVLRGAGISSKFVDKVKDLILITKHDSAPEYKDSALMVDIDLASLALPRDVFKENNMDIREEYSWATDQEYRDGRAKFAESMLSRPSIFQTEFFRQRNENKARRNMEMLAKGLW